MLQHVIFLFSESVTLLAVLCLSLGMLVYFTLHNWQRVAALSRNRSQLLSVGVVLAVVLLILQLSPSGRGRAGDVASDDFFAAADPLARPAEHVCRGADRCGLGSRSDLS